jgi:hypothetical protein
METLAAQPRLTETNFDQGKRRYDDLTTLFAEMLDGSMRTPFEFTYDGEEIRGRDGKVMRKDFETGLQEADSIAEVEPRLVFEVRRRRSEIDEHYDMRKMATGKLPNTMVVVSDFPAELMNVQQDIGGYNVSRKQTMLRVIAWNEGTFKMFTQSLDGSDRAALERMYHKLGYLPREGELLGQRMHLELSADEQLLLTDQLMHTYDTELQAQHGGNWYAGRRDDIRINTYDFVRAQHDIVQLAMTQSRQGTADYVAIAEALRQRFEDNKRLRPTHIIARHMNPFENLAAELVRAGNAARVMGRVFSACGLTFNAASGASTSDQLAEAGYGNKSTADEDEKGPLTFKCKNGHTNRRPRGKLISQCRVKSCKDSVGC